MASLLLVAGDPSGDAHGAALVAALKRRDSSLSFAAFAGPHVRDAGVELLGDLTQAASIGPFDAAKHLGRFIDVRKKLEAYLRERRPDAVILIDFGDFNLPVVAPLAKQFGCRVLYYVSPQIWAWGRFRLRWVQQHVDRMIVLFRFEEEFYHEAGVAVTWVGHPLLDHVGARRSRDELEPELGVNGWRRTVGLLPGSRAKEISRNLPTFLAAARHIAWRMPGVQFVMPKAPSLPMELFAAARRNRHIEVIVRENRMHDGLQVMDAAIVASGTATLETALFEVPMAVVYKTSWPTFLAAKSVVRVPNIAMVNLIAGKTVVPEFVQHHARPRAIADHIVDVLRNPRKADAIRAELRAVKERLGPPGAVDRAALAVMAELSQQNREVK